MILNFWLNKQHQADLWVLNRDGYCDNNCFCKNAYIMSMCSIMAEL